MNWRRCLIILHRDLGYFLTGIVLIYAISGIALNHADDWNPSFVIERHEVVLDLPPCSEIDKDGVLAMLTPLGEAGNYRAFDFPGQEKIKIYLKQGDIVASLRDGRGSMETIRSRPLLHQLNMLHLHPDKWWKVFSDLFAIGLILIAVTGLVVPRGRQGILGRGKWLVGAGMLIPIVAILTL